MCDKLQLEDADLEKYQDEFTQRKFSAAIKIITTYSQILSLMLSVVKNLPGILNTNFEG